MFIKNKVSQNKRRYKDSNLSIDLDLAYVTPRIIAMAYPANGVATVWRNNIKTVAKLFKHKHPSSFMFYNLEGTNYDSSLVDGRVMTYIWKDHHTPSLEILFKVVYDMHRFLS